MKSTIICLPLVVSKEPGNNREIGYIHEMIKADGLDGQHEKKDGKDRSQMSTTNDSRRGSVTRELSSPRTICTDELEENSLHR